MGLALLLAFGLNPTPASASTVQALELGELVEQADEVLLGEVLSQESVWKGRMIVTQTRVRVLDALKGACAEQDELMVETIGGSVGSVGLRVPGSASFEVGQRVVLFGRGDMHEGLRAVGMAQGVLHVREEAGRDVVHPARGDLALVRRSSGGQLVRAPGALLQPEPLGELLQRIRVLAAPAGKATSAGR